jgi:catechol 2,3-dioxygenase
MNTFRLPDETHIGHVHLQVSDLDRSLRFYADLLGFKEVKRGRQTAYLSASGQMPYHIVLTEIPNAQPKPPRTTGLYHVAIRLPNRRELARVFQRLLDHNWRFHGFSDHKVSEAIYLSDPDDNGLELYRDRPREQWPWQDGQIAMRTDPLDVDDLLREAVGGETPWIGIHPATDIGHVHLHVADLTRTEAFYHDLLGFDVMQRDYPGALFFAAGGYHHHLGTNIWAGIGAPPPLPDAVGLRYFTVVVPDEGVLDQVAKRAQTFATAVEEEVGALLLRDPSQNGVLLMTDEERP